MPRDLSAIAKEDTLQGMPELTKSPEEVDRIPMAAEDEATMFSQLAERNEKRDELHPYTNTLKVSDIDSCVRLEEETFPPHERCTREKVSRSIINSTQHYTILSP